MVEKVIYPAYLDSELSRSDGRRVASANAVADPSVDEIATAVGQVGYDTIVERSVAYPREHWKARGRVLVQNAGDAKKRDLVQATGAYLQALRE